MDVKTLHNKSVKELHQLLAEKRAEVQSSTFKVGSGQLKQVHQIALLKKDIAQILTVMNAVRRTGAKS